MSGTLTGSSVTASGGNAGNYFFVNWQDAGENRPGNYSTINWQAYFHFNGDDAQLDAGSVGSNAGTLYSNGGRVYNYSGNFSTRDLGIASGSFNIGHDANGNCTLSLNNSIAVYQSGTSSGSASWGLPSIQRHATPTSFYSSGVGIYSFTLNGTTNEGDGNIGFSIDGGGSYPAVATGTGGWSHTFTGLLANHTYTCYMYGQDPYSGFLDYSGPIYVTTLPAPGFFLNDF